MVRASRSPSAVYLVSSPPATHQHRHVDPGQAVPQRLLGAGAGQPQAGSQAACGTAEPGLQSGGAGRQGGEERLVEPEAQKGFDPVRLDPGRQGIVGAPPVGPLTRVVNAGGGADEHQAVDGLGMAEGHVEGVPAAHGVPDPGPRTARGVGGCFDHEVGAGVQAGDHAGRCAVARGVEGHDGVAPGQGLGDCAPGAGRLGEPMDQHYRVPLARSFDVQHPMILA